MAKRNENDKCEVYFAADIQEKLGIGKTKTYEFLKDVYMQKSPFTVFKIGELCRVPKASFDRWYYTDNV